jgi:hypothetical protein
MRVPRKPRNDISSLGYQNPTIDRKDSDDGHGENMAQ